ERALGLEHVRGRARDEQRSLDPLEGRPERLRLRQVTNDELDAREVVEEARLRLDAHQGAHARTLAGEHPQRRLPVVAGSSGHQDHRASLSTASIQLARGNDRPYSQKCACNRWLGAAFARRPGRASTTVLFSAVLVMTSSSAPTQGSATPTFWGSR